MIESDDLLLGLYSLSRCLLRACLSRRDVTLTIARESYTFPVLGTTYDNKLSDSMSQRAVNDLGRRSSSRESRRAKV